jgi:hypothetical protein
MRAFCATAVGLHATEMRRLQDLDNLIQYEQGDRSRGHELPAFSTSNQTFPSCNQLGGIASGRDRRMSGETRGSCRRLRKLSPGSRTTNGACRHGSRTQLQVLLAAQQLASPTNSFPSFPSRLTKRRLVAWPPCFTSHHRRQIPVRPSVCHVVSNNSVWLVWSVLEQITTQPFGKSRPARAIIASIGPNTRTRCCNQASSISSTRK